MDGSGQRMTPTHAVKKGRRYRYYVSTPLITGTRSDHARGWRVPAGDVEALVLDRLRAFLDSEKEVGDALAPFDLDASVQRAAFARAKQIADRWTELPSLELRGLTRSVIGQVVIEDEGVVVRLKREAMTSTLTNKLVEATSDTETRSKPIDVSIEAKLRRAGKGVRLVVGGGAAEPPDGRLMGLLRDAHAARDALLTGRDETIDAMALRLGVGRYTLAAMVRAAYLAPDIVRSIVKGAQPDGLTPAKLLDACRDLPHDWRLQREVLGLKTP